MLIVSYFFFFYLAELSIFYLMKLFDLRSSAALGILLCTPPPKKFDTLHVCLHIGKSILMQIWERIGSAT